MLIDAKPPTGLIWVDSSKLPPEAIELIKKATHEITGKPSDIPQTSRCGDCSGKAVTQSRGLGDTIYKITHATHLDKLAEIYTQITGKPCGCDKRQDALNKLFPYGVKEE